MTLKKTLALALVVVGAAVSAGPSAIAAETAKKPAKAAATAAAAPSQQQSQLSAQKDWKAFIYHDASGNAVCYASTSPKKSEPTSVKRDPIYLFITNRPSTNVSNEISIDIGYPFKDGATVGVQIGSQTFSMITAVAKAPSFAWSKSAADEKRMITAMKAGHDLIVTGTSKRGTNTKDTFSLAGLGTVLNAIDTQCK